MSGYKSLNIYLFMFVVGYLYLYVSDARAHLPAWLLQAEMLRVCVLAKGASGTSIMIENGGIREGPVFPPEKRRK